MCVYLPRKASYVDISKKELSDCVQLFEWFENTIKITKLTDDTKNVPQKVITSSLRVNNKLKLSFL